MAEDAGVGNIGNGGDYEDRTVKKLSLTSKNSNRTTSYLTLDAKQAFIQLKQAFIKAPILRHFDSECHIQIETDLLGYTIGRVLN